MSYFENNDLFVQPKVAQYGSNMVMTNVLKENKTKYVNIDTRFSDEYKETNSKSEYSINLSEKITDVKKVQIKSIELPISYYNISANLGNNTFQIISQNGTTYKCIVPDGYYTHLTLISELNENVIENISTLKNKIIFAINSFNKITIENQLDNVGEKIIINFNTDENVNITKHNLKSRLGWLMGFRDYKYEKLHTLTTTKMTAEATIDLNIPKYLYVAMDEFGKGNQNSFISPLPSSLINKNIIARICCDYTQYPQNTVLTANEYNGLLISDIRSYTGKIDIQKLNIKILNEFGVVMDLNGLDYSFLLKFEHE